MNAKRLSVVILALIVGMSTVGFFWILTGTDYLKLRRSGSNTIMFLENETDGVLNLSTNTSGTETPSSIGDLRPTGIAKTLYYPVVKDTLGDGWLCNADSDNGLRLSADFIIDSVSVFANWGAGDTLFMTTYKTTANAQTISGPDTLTSTTLRVYKTVDFTGDADTLRSFDVSAGKFPAFYLNESGNVDSAFVVAYGRDYDVQ